MRLTLFSLSLPLTLSPLLSCRWSGEPGRVWIRRLNVRVDAPQARHERRGRLVCDASVTMETGDNEEEQEEKMTELDWTEGEKEALIPTTN